MVSIGTPLHQDNSKHGVLTTLIFQGWDMGKQRISLPILTYVLHFILSQLLQSFTFQEKEKGDNTVHGWFSFLPFHNELQGLKHTSSVFMSMQIKISHKEMSTYSLYLESQRGWRQGT